MVGSLKFGIRKQVGGAGIHALHAIVVRVLTTRPRDLMSGDGH